MKNKTLIILFVALAIAVVILFFVKQKQAKKQETAVPLAPDNQAGSLATILEAVIGMAGKNNTGSSVYLDNSGFPLKKESTGKGVSMLQAAIGAPITGVWDSPTDLRCKAMGIVVPITAQKFTDLCLNASGKNEGFFPLKKGSKNNYVKAVQILLNASPDGIWGTETDRIVTEALGKNVMHHIDYSTLAANVLGLNLKYKTKADEQKAFNGYSPIGMVKQLLNKQK